MPLSNRGGTPKKRFFFCCKMNSWIVAEKENLRCWVNALHSIESNWKEMWTKMRGIHWASFMNGLVNRSENRSCSTLYLWSFVNISLLVLWLQHSFWITSFRWQMLRLLCMQMSMDHVFLLSSVALCVCVFMWSFFFSAMRWPVELNSDLFFIHFDRTKQNRFHLNEKKMIIWFTGSACNLSWN